VTIVLFNSKLKIAGLQLSFEIITAS